MCCESEFQNTNQSETWFSQPKRPVLFSGKISLCPELLVWFFWFIWFFILHPLFVYVVLWEWLGKKPLTANCLPELWLRFLFYAWPGREKTRIWLGHTKVRQFGPHYPLQLHHNPTLAESDHWKTGFYDWASNYQWLSWTYKGNQPI